MLFFIFNVRHCAEHVLRMVFSMLAVTFWFLS